MRHDPRHDERISSGAHGDAHASDGARLSGAPRPQAPTRRRIRAAARLALACLAGLAPSAARATEPEYPGTVAVEGDPAAHSPDDAQRDWLGRWRSALDNEWYKVSLDTRARLGLADIKGFRTSQAWTVRNRFGIGSKPWQGLSAFVEGEGTFSFRRKIYYDGAGENRRRRSIISDPETIELNRAFGRLHRPDWLGLDLIGGRQRIIFDDARFIGNVGWRQNEQTFDAGYGSTTLGLDGLTAHYGYMWYINRIWSDQGKESTRDWDSRSHIVNVSYEVAPWLKAAGFAYFLDFKNDSRGNSSNSYGFRVTGSKTFDEVWKVGYAGSFAHQTDAGNNPEDYDARYGWVEGSFGHRDFVTVGSGYEILGSDDGRARFVTPLATAHKFNGFADAFLDNGGNDGLQDLFVWISPKLPFGIKGKFIYHRFWEDESGRRIGNEWDFVLTRKLKWDILALIKGAFYDGRNDQDPADRWRLTFELNHKF